jgi:hypothetical protein
MKSRFTDEVLSVIQQMSFFTHSGLLSKEERKEEEITELCKNYGLDSSCVVIELNEFRTVYRNVHHMINVDDMIDRTRKSKNLIDKEQDAIDAHITEVDADNDGDSDESGDESDGSYCSTEGHGAKPDVDVSSAKRWIEHSFVKPLRVLEEISSYPYLAAMYKILASLAVTSASAERVLSRVRIIKNRLRTSMIDDWFAALTILASEKDVMRSISTEDVINSFSQCSSRLRAYLI